MKITQLLEICFAFALTAMMMIGGPAQAQTSPAGASASGKTELLWLGQASFRIKSPGGKVIVIDPWLTAGPKAPAAYTDLAALCKVDLLLVTHAPVDHLGEARAIAKLNNTVLYGPGDMVTTCRVALFTVWLT